MGLIRGSPERLNQDDVYTERKTPQELTHTVLEAGQAQSAL